MATQETHPLTKHVPRLVQDGRTPFLVPGAQEDVVHGFIPNDPVDPTVRTHWQQEGDGLNTYSLYNTQTGEKLTGLERVDLTIDAARKIRHDITIYEALKG